MAAIVYGFADGRVEEIEVTEDFAAEYAEIEHREYLVNRKETRRHQSLDKSLEHGWDIADKNADVFGEVVRREQADKLYAAISRLTERQRTVVLLHAFYELPFRVIGEKIGLGTYTVRDYYYAAVKKLKKFLS